MKITISGKAGSGKSTIAKEVAKALKLKHYSSGDFMREMAKKKKVSLLKLSKMAEEDLSIDRAIDDRQIEFGKKNDNFVIDGRLSFHFIPKSIKVFLGCDNKQRVERIFEQQRVDEVNKDAKQTLKNIEEREESERKRYKNLYDIDYTDKKHYDLFLDTTNFSIEQVTSAILKFVEEHKKIEEAEKQ